MNIKLSLILALGLLGATGEQTYQVYGVDGSDKGTITQEELEQLSDKIARRPDGVIYFEKHQLDPEQRVCQLVKVMVGLPSEFEYVVGSVGPVEGRPYRIEAGRPIQLYHEVLEALGIYVTLNTNANTKLNDLAGKRLMFPEIVGRAITAGGAGRLTGVECRFEESVIRFIPKILFNTGYSGQAVFEIGTPALTKEMYLSCREGVKQLLRQRGDFTEFSDALGCGLYLIADFATEPERISKAGLVTSALIDVFHHTIDRLIESNLPAA